MRQVINSIRSIDLRFIDDLVDFVRGPGFVLDFSDTRFSDFFASELRINIDDPKYATHGGSKGKRLRYFLQTCDDATAVRALEALWEHRNKYLTRSGGADPVASAEKRYQGLINRLSGGSAPSRPSASPQPVPINRAAIIKIKTGPAAGHGVGAACARVCL